MDPGWVGLGRLVANNQRKSQSNFEYRRQTLCLEVLLGLFCPHVCFSGFLIYLFWWFSHQIFLPEAVCCGLHSPPVLRSWSTTAESFPYDVREGLLGFT